MYDTKQTSRKMADDNIDHGDRDRYFWCAVHKQREDMTELKSFIGDYQALESGSPDDKNYVPGSWHLFISEDHEEKGPYLSIYDSAAGNPGFEGRIMYLKDADQTLQTEFFALRRG